MSFDYPTLRPFLLWPHALLGVVVLVLGVVVLVLPKGTSRHVALGRVFYWAMLVSVACAVPLMLLSSNWLLLLLSVLSFYMLVSGRREILRHRAGDRPFSTFDRAFTLTTLGSCAFMVALGIYGLLAGTFRGFAPVLLGLGAVGANLAWDGWRRRDGPPRHRLAWMEDHVGMMVGCFIAATTAFSAVNLGRVEGLPTPLVWLAPTLILVPLIHYWGKGIRKRAGV